MNTATPQDPPNEYDAVIIGGAFSGAATARLLKRRCPEARVLIIERSESFDRKVGESTSEVAACFLTRVLGLTNYLAREHFGKHGLRLWFDREGNEDLGACSEVGPMWQVRLPTFQLNRATLDAHLLEQAASDGCEIVRPATVASCELGGEGKNVVTFKQAGEVRTATARWLIDASGKAAMLARRRKTLQVPDGHPTRAMWTRFKGVRDLDDPELHARHEEYAMAAAAPRSTATNHLMGLGWWCWIIPLANGEVSAGLTWDDRIFTPPEEGTLAERLKEHLLTTPVGEWLFAEAEPVEKDSHQYSGLPYFNAEVAGDGWACVGDACGFMDPLYSQGLDYCSHSISAVVRFVADALDGNAELALGRREKFIESFPESYHRWFEALYRDKYYYIGDAELMWVAYQLDLACYFFGPVRFVHGANAETEFASMPYDGYGGELFAKFMAFYNRRLVAIARKRLAAGVYGRRNLGRRRLVARGFSTKPGHSLIGIIRGVAGWIGCELHALTLPKAPEGGDALTWENATATSTQ